MAGYQDERGSRAGHEAAAREQRKGRRVGAEEIPRGCDEAPDGERRPAPEAVREPAGGHGDEKAREPVDRDGHADGRLRHAEGPGIQRQDRHDAAEASW